MKLLRLHPASHKVHRKRAKKLPGSILTRSKLDRATNLAWGKGEAPKERLPHTETHTELTGARKGSKNKQRKGPPSGVNSADLAQQNAKVDTVAMDAVHHWTA